MLISQPIPCCDVHSRFAAADVQYNGSVNVVFTTRRRSYTVGAFLQNVVAMIDLIV